MTAPKRPLVSRPKGDSRAGDKLTKSHAESLFRGEQLVWHAFFGARNYFLQNRIFGRRQLLRFLCARRLNLVGAKFLRVERTTGQ